jgi:hypothetical protein
VIKGRQKVVFGKKITFPCHVSNVPFVRPVAVVIRRQDFFVKFKDPFYTAFLRRVCEV